MRVEPPDPIARLEDLSYWYPGDVRALIEVDFELGSGLSLVTGPSGGGKSSFLRLFNGLIPQFHGGRIQGRATVLGHDIVRTPPRTLARDVGFVFQDPEKQVVYGSVEREVAFGLENLGVDRRTMSERVGEALERLDLLRLRGRQIASLSGGERQRVAIASVLAMQPRLIVLDEPTSELDAHGAQSVVDACIHLAASGLAILIAEHRLERLLPAASRFVRVEAGRVDGQAGRPRLEAPRARRADHLLARSAASEPAWSVRDLVAGPAGLALVECAGLSAEPGEVVALTGANGSGKSTLLRTIAGLLMPLSGEVDRVPGRVAYLPQDPGALLHRPTVIAEVIWTLERAASPNPTSEARATLAAFGLGDLGERDPRDLSAGERQRAALAVILAGRPTIALLDEPTRGMDDAARRSLARVLDDLRATGCAIVVATHDEGLVTDVADRVVAIEHGRVAEQIRAEAVFDVPLMVAG